MVRKKWDSGSWDHLGAGCKTPSEVSILMGGIEVWLSEKCEILGPEINYVECKTRKWGEIVYMCKGLGENKRMHGKNIFKIIFLFV